VGIHWIIEFEVVLWCWHCLEGGVRNANSCKSVKQLKHVQVESKTASHSTQLTEKNNWEFPFE